MRRTRFVCRWSFVVRRTKVVLQFPYAITSAALRHFLEADHKPALIVVLVQWEVAERIAARAGHLSVLAHAIQVYARPEIVARVPAGSFSPVPAVDWRCCGCTCGRGRLWMWTTWTGCCG